MEVSCSPWWCQPELIRGAVRTKPAHIPAEAIAASRVMPEVWVVSVVRSSGRIRWISDVLFATSLLLVIHVRVRAPALVLLVQLRPAARDPRLDRPAPGAIGRQRRLAVVPVGALEVDGAAFDGEREHGQLAGVAVRRAVRPQQWRLQQAAADPSRSCPREMLPYTIQDRRGAAPPRPFAPDPVSPSPPRSDIPALREPVRGQSRRRRCGMANRPYELMYLIQPSADEERLGAISERIQSTITSLGGAVQKVVPPVRRRLAYEIGRHREGQYQVMEFTLPTEQARELERTIKLTEDILRHLVVRRDGSKKEG